MGFFSGIKRAVKRVRKPIKKLVGIQAGVASGLPPDKVKRIATAGVKVAKASVTGSLDPIGAATAGVINPTLAVNAFPRETLLGAGAVAAGTFLTGATAANTGAAAGSVGTGAAVTTGGGILGTSLTLDQIKDKAKDEILEKLSESKSDPAQVVKSSAPPVTSDKGLLDDPKTLLIGAGLLLSVISLAKGGG